MSTTNFMGGELNSLVGEEEEGRQSAHMEETALVDL